MAQVKTAISIPASLFEQADELAQHMNVSRSQLFAMAMEAFILQSQNRQLFDDINAAYHDQPDPSEQEHLAQMKSRHLRRLQNDAPW